MAAVDSSTEGPPRPPTGGEGTERVRRKKDFRKMELVNGRMVNVLEGLELHAGVFSPAEQHRIVASVYDFQGKGRRGCLRERTYSEPRKWMRGKGRITIQFGCCYNYATDRNGNPPGIIRDEEVDPIPPVLKTMIKRMVEWHVLPPTCIPNSCIVNIYDKDDCIPPHIDHHDFVRPFCTVSFLTECNILFGRELKVVGPGEFSGAASISLPVGSVLVLKGNGADVAKHCVPAVPAKRISITFRKMDDRKLPFRFTPDPELQRLAPLPYPVRPAASNASPISTPPPQARPQHNPREQAQSTSSLAPIRTPEQQERRRNVVSDGSPASSTPGTPQQRQGSAAFGHGHRVQRPPHYQTALGARQGSGSPFSLTNDDFPALGASVESRGQGRR